MLLENKIKTFFTEIIKEYDVSRVLNQTFETLSEMKGVGLDSMIQSLHYQCIESDSVEFNIEGGFESADGKYHMAVICVPNDDTQEHCFGEWLEKHHGVVVLEPSRDNNDGEVKAMKYLETKDYTMFNKNESIPEYLRNDGWFVVEPNEFKEWAIRGLESKGYTCIVDTNVDEFCVDHLTEKNYFVCDNNPGIKQLVKLHTENPKLFAYFLNKDYHYKIDSCIDFGLSGVVSAKSQDEAKGMLDAELESKLCALEELMRGKFKIDRTKIKVVWS